LVKPDFADVAFIDAPIRYAEEWYDVFFRRVNAERAAFEAYLFGSSKI